MAMISIQGVHSQLSLLLQPHHLEKVSTTRTARLQPSHPRPALLCRNGEGLLEDQVGYGIPADLLVLRADQAGHMCRR